MHRESMDRLLGVMQIDDFRHAFESSIADSSGTNAVSLALLDIDMFKAVNDQHGHSVGDEVLKDIVAHLQSHLSDSAQVYRNGGDEFAILFPGIEKEEAFLLMEKVRTAYAGERSYDGVSLDQTISVGITTYPEDGHTMQEILRKGADAMFRAKTMGRDRVCLAREEKKVTKTTHYTQGQLDRLSQLSEKEAVGEAELLREALDDLLKKYST